MPLLGVRVGGVVVPFRNGNTLISPPVGAPGCACCPRYDCLPGTVDCQRCEFDRNGPYRSMAECTPECPAETCMWCIEIDEPGPCGESYVTYTCTATPCDEDGVCIHPGLPVVAGPIKVADPFSVDCFNDLCPTPPDPPPTPECCDPSECPCCYTCYNGDCIGCPPGTVCIDCQCVPIEESYYCCKEPDVYGEPPKEPFCQLGPCAPPLETVGGPYGDYNGCCASCGCFFDCNPLTYGCFPDPLGPYELLDECEEECIPPGTGGACCYTIAPYSEDNETVSPVEGCALIKGCFGIMSYEACEALKTDTGTNTTWYADYDTCDLCPVTESTVCCYDDPDNPCVTMCVETDESCCDALDGTQYFVPEDCEDTWPSGLDACRDDLACAWPDPDAETYFEAIFKERLYEYTPPPPVFLDPPCIKAPEWNAGYPDNMEGCDWRWLREETRCHQPDLINRPFNYGETCVRYRLLMKKGSRIVDITSDAVANTGDMECCSCRRLNNWAACQGNECEPLPFLTYPEANCPP